jgi:hypothetical protein
MICSELDRGVTVPWASALRARWHVGRRLIGHATEGYGLSRGWIGREAGEACADLPLPPAAASRLAHRPPTPPAATEIPVVFSLALAAKRDDRGVFGARQGGKSREIAQTNRNWVEMRSR